MRLRIRKSRQYDAAPARMRTAVLLSPCGMGRATTTTLPEAGHGHAQRVLVPADDDDGLVCAPG